MDIKHCCCCCKCPKDNAPDANPPIPPRPTPTTPKPDPDVSQKTTSSFLAEDTWNLTIPLVDPSKGNAKMIQFPELKTFNSPHYKITSKGILLTVPTKGSSTTKNSKYPRCEFRELNRDGSKAAWSTDGDHIMTVETTVLKTTKNKPHICIAQIHDTDDDIIMLRYEGGDLVISGRGFEKEKIGSIALGKPISIIVQCKDSNITMTVNGKVSKSQKIPAKGCYFKAGNYLQSNETHDKDDYGEVLLEYLKVVHK